MKKAATKAEREHMSGFRFSLIPRIRSLTQVHHLPRQGGQKDNMRCIPMCPLHHRHGNAGVAIHSGRKSFEKAFGTTENKLLARTLRMLK